MKIGYTTIMHEPRIELGLSTDEYCLLDLVYRLSTNPTAPVVGWCSMSKDTMVSFLGIKRRTLFRVIDRMEEAGYLEKSGDGRFLRTTMKWITNVVNFDYKVSGTHSAKVALGYSASSALGHSANVALKNNIYKNNNRESNNALAFEFLKKNFQIRFEQEFMMRYGSKIKDLKKFQLDFDATVEKEELKYTDRILFARLGQYARNWISNQDKFNSKTDNEEQQQTYRSNAI